MNAPNQVLRWAADPFAFICDVHYPAIGRLGDSMAEFQREAFVPLCQSLMATVRGEQPAVAKHWWERTKGASKTIDIAACVIWAAAFSPRPLRIIFAARDAGQAAELWQAVSDLLRTQGPANDAVASVLTIQRERIVNEKTKTTIAVLAADDKGSHGARPDITIIDEFTHIDNQGFTETLADNDDKVKHSTFVCAMNAGNTETWQWGWREIAIDSPLWHFAALTAPAPWISKAALELSRRRNSPSRYRRLWGGEWLPNSGDALSEEDIQAAVTLTGPMEIYDPRMLYGAGLDLSTKRDRSALVVLAADSARQRVRLAYCRTWKPDPVMGVDLAAIRRETIDVSRRFGCSVWYDPYQAGLLAQDLALAGVDSVEMTFAGKNLDLMASAVLQAFRERRIDLYDGELVADLRRLSIVERPPFGYKLTASRSAKDGHADAAIAMSIVLPSALQTVMNMMEPFDSAHYASMPMRLTSER